MPVNLDESSLSLFDTTPYNAISVPSVPATFKVVSTGTTTQKPLLVSSDGFSYSVKTVRPTSTLWHCTKRSRRRRRSDFLGGDEVSNHPGDEVHRVTK